MYVSVNVVFIVCLESGFVSIGDISRVELSEGFTLIGDIDRDSVDAEGDSLAIGDRDIDSIGVGVV